VSGGVAILDFGSGKITAMIGKRGVNNTIKIIGMSEVDYAGFSDGIFFEPSQISYAVAKALSNAEQAAQVQIKHLYVGVPAEFTISKCKEVIVSYQKRKTVGIEDIDQLFAQGNEFEGHPEYHVINMQPIYFTLDDERRLIQPVGLKSSRLGGLVSYSLAEKGFLERVNTVMKEVGVESHEFVSSLLAETLFLFSDVKRDGYVVLVDCGHITTSVTLARGDGILAHFSFPLGGGHITGDLSKYLNIPFNKAEALKRKAVLSLDASEGDVYETHLSRDEVLTYPADIVNEIIMEGINKIAKGIEKCLNACTYDFPQSLPYHLTGGGLASIKGARDYLSKVLRKPIHVVAPSLPQLNRPHLSSSLGLLDMVLKSESGNEKKKGFFSKIFK